MSDFNWVPDFGVSIDEEVRTKSMKFGDGYEQRAPDGLNPISMKLSMTFTRKVEDITPIVSFLRSKSGGQAFTFTPVGSPEIKVKCLKWSTTIEDVGVHKLKVDMERVYE
jgi:phage-related protein